MMKNSEASIRADRMARAKQHGALIDGLICVTFNKFDGDVIQTARHYGLTAPEVAYIVKGR